MSGKRGALVVVLAAVVGLALVPNLSDAAPTSKGDVRVVNTATEPVPVTANQPLPVNVTNAQPMAVNVTNAQPMAVNVTNAQPMPYQDTEFFNQTNEVCTQFVCTVVFDPVPEGFRLDLTYASAKYALSSGGTAASVRVGIDGGIEPSVLLPAPVNTGFDTWLAAGPVTLHVAAGQAPSLSLGGQFVQPSSNTAETAVSGYLIPVP